MLYRKNPNYKDYNIAFSLRTYYNTDLTKWCLSNLRQHFPKARLILISDGDDSTAEDFKEFKVEFFKGEHLYSTRFGGKIIQRMIDLFLHHGHESLLIKIDNDTGIHRRFNWIPEGYGAYGTLQHDGYLNSIQGGFTAIDYDAAVNIYKSGLCMSESLKKYELTYALSPFIYEFCKSGRLGEDWLFGYIFSKLGIPMLGYDEVKCGWGIDFQENPDKMYAVTHPNKTLQL